MDAEIEEHNRKLEIAFRKRFFCVDCGKDTIDEYYMVSDELWATTGLEPEGGMLCLADLAKRIGRQLTFEGFTAKVPSREAWARYNEAHECLPGRATGRPQLRVIDGGAEP